MSVIGYVRVSTKEQTVENQKQTITGKGYSVDRWYADEAVSGSVKGVNRDGMGALINYVREGDTVVIVGVDRLGRNTVDVLNTIDTLKEKKVNVISLREGVDLSTPTGIAVVSIMASLAQLEKDLIAERRTAGIARAKAEGIHCGRPVKVTTEEIDALVAAGCSPKEVMAELSISKATFYRLKSK